MRYIIGLFISLFAVSLWAMEQKELQHLEEIDVSPFIELTDSKIISVIRTYTKDNKVVKLIPLGHTASPEFYETIQKLIENQIIIYELYGNRIEDKYQLESDIKNYLGYDYLVVDDAIQSFNWLTKEYGYVDQFYLSYKGAKKAIHGDIDLKETFPCMEEVKNYIERTYQDQLCKCKLATENKMKDNVSLIEVEQLMKEREVLFGPNVSNNIAKNYKQKIEQLESLNTDIKNGLVRCTTNKSPQSDLFKQCKKFQTIVTPKKLLFEDLKNGIKTRGKKELQSVPNIGFEIIAIQRNNCIYEALKNEWKTLQENQEQTILVVYGAMHMPFVQNFLFEQGFKDSQEIQKITLFEI